ncbi:MAG: hypothetical protein ACXVEF_17050 [Polyangiales bacterium]
MKTLAGLGAWGVVAMVGGIGCIAKPDDGARFREAIPATEQVQLAVPRDGGSSTTTKSLRIKGGTTTYAKWYQFTRDVADGADWGTAQILGLVTLIVHQPPTKTDAKSATWGPGGDPLDPITWRFVATEVGDREYDYVLAGRPRASTSDADFKPILSGHGWGDTHPKHGEGWFLIDNDAKNAMDPARAKDTGSVRVGYDLKSWPARTITADLTSTGWFKLAYTRKADGSGDLDITALGDVEEEGKKDGIFENIALHSQWAVTGAGRADVEVTGGSLPATIPKVDASECWGTSFARVYYTDSVSIEPTTGDASSCAFTAKTF